MRLSALSLPAAVLAMTFAAAVSLGAQTSPGPRAGLTSPVAHREALLSSASADSVPHSQWKKGMLIGAGVGVVAVGFLYELSHRVSDTSGSVNPIGLVLVVGLFGLLGGLIGSAFH